MQPAVTWYNQCMSDLRQRLRASDVFTPNEFPRYTYVTRPSKYEDLFVSFMRIGGTIVAISGPSKSGKTILVRRVVGDSNLVFVPCGGIDTPSMLWDRVLDRLRVPATTATTAGRESSLGFGGEVGSPMLFGTANNVAKVSLLWQQKSSSSITKMEGRRGMTQVSELLAGKDVVLLLDDFHFIPRDVQPLVAEQLKAVAQDGVRFALTVAAHRSDDLERATNQLTGRVANIEIKPWSQDELVEIAYEGFPRLNIAGDILLPHELMREAAGSPQLMQLLCLFTATHCGFDVAASTPTPLGLQNTDIASIMEKSTAMTQRKTVAQIMLNGPKPRGTDRDTFSLRDKTQGDVYYCVSRALVGDPPRLEMTYETIKSRIEHLVIGNPPAGASITSALEKMSELTMEPSTNERVLDWDPVKRQFSIVDPYLWFFLRWSSFLRTGQNSV